MRKYYAIIFFMIPFLEAYSQDLIVSSSSAGYNQRIRNYIDSLEIVDTHEHFFNPDMLKVTSFLDFSLLFQQNSYDALVTSGMSTEMLKKIYVEKTSVTEKWKIIEPYWNRSFNTISNRILILAIKDLYSIKELSSSTVEPLSAKIRNAYSTDWFNHVLKDLCKFSYVIVDGDNVGQQYDYVKYVKRFTAWLTLSTKFRIDSIAVMQVDPIYTLEDYVNSMKVAFEDGLKRGMVAVKINAAYKRSLYFEKVPEDAAKKVFRTLINGNEDMVLIPKDAKLLQDYMMFQLMDLARKYNIPVAIHTGIQAGGPNTLANSDPSLLTNIFYTYPDVDFVLFHGSYPFGGLVTALIRNFKNVYIDMNWTYAISRNYAGRYLDEWIEAVPASKIMAFGGDQRCVENTYGNLIIARQVISSVLSEKVKSGYFTEQEALKVAKMILLDNPKEFYHLK